MPVGLKDCLLAYPFDPLATMGSVNKGKPSERVAGETTDFRESEEKIDEKNNFSSEKY